MLLLFAVSVSLVGYALSDWFWHREGRLGRLVLETGPMERCFSALVATLAFTLAITWALSALRAVHRPGLMIVAVGSAVVAARYLFSRPRGAATTSGARSLWLVAAVCVALPPASWLGFVLWRATLMGPLNHDALAYHLPRAVFFAKQGGYFHLVAPDMRIGRFPANYELLLTDIVVLHRSDRFTEWLGTASWLGVALGGGAVAERRWGFGLHLVPVCLVVAGMPVALLHSGADKNDLLVAVFAIATLMWGARWATSGEWAAAVCTLIAGACAIGTKQHMVFVVACVAVSVVVRRRLTFVNHPRGVLAIALLAVCAFACLGGAAYVDILWSRRTEGAATLQQAPQYGCWTNLWMAPVMMWLAPFSDHTLEVLVPWRDEYWFWPRYELFFSNFGRAVSVLVAAGPVIFLFARRRFPARDFLGLTTAAAFFLVLPLNFPPLGMYAAYPRYVLWAPVILVAWVVPALFMLAVRARAAIVAAALFAFCYEAWEYGTHDRFVPLGAVADAARGGPTRAVPFQPRRAGAIVDQLAAPDAVVAVDGSFDTWLQPIFGRDLTRTVLFLSWPLEVPPAARWVVVDRSYARNWQSPGFVHMGQWRQFLGQGPLPPEDVRVYRALRTDPAWELVFDDRVLNQAVFRRVNLAR